MRNPLIIFGMALLISIFSLAIIGPFFSGYSYSETHLLLNNTSPSIQFWMGTDDLGRDIFTRVCYGARISLAVGFAAAIIDLIFGLFWGGIAGLIGGWVDQVMMAMIDILCSIPSMLIVILLVVVMGSGFFSTVGAIAIFGWINMARIVRGQVLVIKQMDYIYAARMIGASPLRILFRHILPNIWGPILVTLTLTIPSAIFSEAFLSFFGLGIQAPMASWGTMAFEGIPAMSYYPWRLFFPALLISLTMYSFHLIGEGLKQTLCIKHLVA